MYNGVLGFLSPPISSEYSQCVGAPTYQQIETCTNIKQEFERTYVRVNAYDKNKTASKIK